MGLDLKTRNDANVLVVHATGRLELEDYEQFLPTVESLIEKWGKLRILLVLREFHGWTAGALWEDIKFDIKHFRDIERLAIVGEKKWEQRMATFCKPFTTADVKFFYHDQIDRARNWVLEGGSRSNPQPESLHG